MTILNRYLLRRNFFLLVSLVAMGVGIYLLSEFFQRIDVFMEAGNGPMFILYYFALRLPMIVSTILPAVFLLSIVVQFSLMEKNRETVALQAGGVSPVAMLHFVIVYSLAWALVQFCFAQVLAVGTERVAREMWQQEVKKRDTAEFYISGLWFTKGSYVVHLEKAWPNKEQAENIYIYDLSDDGLEIERTLHAVKAETGSTTWTLREVEIMEPATYSFSKQAELQVNVRQDLAAFKTFDPKLGSRDLGLFELYQTIRRLQSGGTNVEGMRTDLHGRYAYAFSLLVMGLLALCITIRHKSIYLAIIVSMLCTFLYYTLSSLLMSMGEKGALSPPLAAWLADIVFMAIACGYLLAQVLKARKHHL